MPIYEYICEDCERVEECLVMSSEEPTVVCGLCGKEMRKIMSTFGFILKGSGFYATDYKQSDRDKKEKQ
jgi:putative FmdB family regulatory protein